jgi:hypothetical protein
MGARATIDILQAAKDSLSPGQKWCVRSPLGEVVPGTEGADILSPILSFCDAASCDWDDASEEGFYLSQTPTDNPHEIPTITIQDKSP